MQDYAKYVDPFLGNGEIDLPKPEGIAATWFFLKAQTGNTHPGACRPMGMVSACPWSGAYVTGYGMNCPSCNGKVTKKFDKYSAAGFTHFHQSGTGAIEKYYNYFRVIPVMHNINEMNRRYTLVDEKAAPGYYSALLKDINVTAQLTVGEKMAFHRYIFHQSGDKSIVVDLSSGGLDFEDRKSRPSQARLMLEGSGAAKGFIFIEGIPIYTYIELNTDAECQIWVENERIAASNFHFKKQENEVVDAPFGVVFDLCDKSKEVAAEVRIGFSLRSAEQAKINALTTSGQSFEEVRQEAYDLWNRYLNAIAVQDGTQEQLKVFYSALYHSLIKPCSFNNESPFWKEKEYYVDFATLWDQYKTQLPLLFTLFPKDGLQIVKSLLHTYQYSGKFPVTVLLSDQFEKFSYQAKGLCHYLLADAFYRRFSDLDWVQIKEMMKNDILANRDFIEKGIQYPISHTLDLSEASYMTALIARQTGDEETFRMMTALSENWRNAYDEDGLLKSTRFYEGSKWHYSFRILHNMEERIALSKGKFTEQLNLFFGYHAEAVEQLGDITEPGFKDGMRQGLSLNRFDGFNNEHDIETPYVWLYAGRHDKTCEIVRTGVKYMFALGRGGLPGNDDSGALSSCLVWNMTGLFPVAGQPVFLIGSPTFKEVTMTINKHQFTIRTMNNSEKNIYVKTASLNGKSLDRAYITIDELLEGGELVLWMSPVPTGWADTEVPPSY